MTLKVVFGGLIAVSTLSSTAWAKCPASYTQSTADEIVANLNGNRHKLRELRALVNDPKKLPSVPDLKREQISTTTHRLEYWSKDFARYVRRYAASNPDAVCDRLINKDGRYMADFLILTSIYSHMPHVAPVRFEDYK